MITKSSFRNIDLVNSVEKSLINKQLIKKKDKILFSISGGQDSICLLVILKQISAQMDFNLGLMWCHHLWQLDSFLLMRQITKVSYLFKLNTYLAITAKPVPSELLARNWRHNCSYRICFFYKYHKISLAHSANDKAETILLNLMRGTGVSGLSPLSWEKKNREKRKRGSQFSFFTVFFFIWSPIFVLSNKKKGKHEKKIKRAKCLIKRSGKSNAAVFLAPKIMQRMCPSGESTNKTNFGSCSTPCCILFTLFDLADDTTENRGCNVCLQPMTIFSSNFSVQAVQSKIVQLAKTFGHQRLDRKQSQVVIVAQVRHIVQVFVVQPKVFANQVCTKKMRKQKISWIVEKVILKKHKLKKKSKIYKRVNSKTWFYFVSYTFFKVSYISFQHLEKKKTFHFNDIVVSSHRLLQSLQPLVCVFPISVVLFTTATCTTCACLQTKFLLKDSENVVQPLQPVRSKNVIIALKRYTARLQQQKIHNICACPEGYAAELQQHSVVACLCLPMHRRCKNRRLVAICTDCTRRVCSPPLVLAATTRDVNKKFLLINSWQWSSQESKMGFVLEKQNCSTIRPLLSLNRFDISRLCLYWQLPVYPDKSNQKLNFLRNRVRKQLLPTIKFFFNVRIEHVLLQFAEIFSAENSYINKITTKFFKKLSNASIFDEENIVVHNQTQLFLSSFILPQRQSTKTKSFFFAFKDQPCLSRYKNKNETKLFHFVEPKVVGYPCLCLCLPRRGTFCCCSSAAYPSSANFACLSIEDAKTVGWLQRKIALEGYASYVSLWGKQQRKMQKPSSSNKNKQVESVDIKSKIFVQSVESVLPVQPKVAQITKKWKSIETFFHYGRFKSLKQKKTSVEGEFFSYSLRFLKFQHFRSKRKILSIHTRYGYSPNQHKELFTESFGVLQPWICLSQSNKMQKPLIAPNAQPVQLLQPTQSTNTRICRINGLFLQCNFLLHRRLLFVLAVQPEVGKKRQIGCKNEVDQTNKLDRAYLCLPRRVCTFDSTTDGGKTVDCLQPVQSVQALQPVQSSIVQVAMLALKGAHNEMQPITCATITIFDCTGWNACTRKCTIKVNKVVQHNKKRVIHAKNTISLQLLNLLVCRKEKKMVFLELLEREIQNKVEKLLKNTFQRHTIFSHLYENYFVINHIDHQKFIFTLPWTKLKHLKTDLRSLIKEKEKRITRFVNPGCNPLITLLRFSIPAGATFWIWTRKLGWHRRNRGYSRSGITVLSTFNKELLTFYASCIVRCPVGAEKIDTLPSASSACKNRRLGSKQQYGDIFNIFDSTNLASTSKADDNLNIQQMQIYHKKGKNKKQKLFLKFHRLEQDKKEIYWPLIIAFLPLAIQRRFIKLFLVNQNLKQIQYSQIEQFLTILKKI